MKFSKLSRLHGLPVAAVIFAFSGQAAFGAILSQWTFDEVNREPSNVAAGVTAGNFGTTGTFNGTTGPIAPATVSGVGGTAPYVFGANGLSTSEAGAVSANHLYTFTLTPTIGNMASFSALSFYAWANTNFNADSYTFFVRSSQSGTTTLDDFTSDLKRANSSAPTTDSQFTLNLTGVAALQNVTSETTFTIGVYVNNPPATGFQGNLRIDSISLEGDVLAIPEPSALLLSGIAGAFLGMRRRR